VNNKPEFQDIQTFTAFDNDNKIIADRSLSLSRFNYQKEIQHKKILEADNTLIKKLFLIINIEQLRH